MTQKRTKLKGALFGYIIILCKLRGVECLLDFYFSLSHYMKQIFEEFPENLSFTQMAILYELNNREDLTMQKVAQQVAMDITTFSRQVATLEKKGYLERTPSKQDRRYYFLGLTEEGKRAVNGMEQLYQTRFGQLFSGMNEFEKDTIIRSLHALSNILRGER